jgi:hypothetical protein
MVDEVALREVFSPSTSVFPCQFHSTGVPLLGKGQKIITIFIFLTGLHKKPKGCGAPVASAAGPFSTETPPKKYYITQIVYGVTLIVMRL